MKVALVGAPSSIGIRPDDANGEPQHIDLAPATLRSLGVLDAVGAVDLGDVRPPDYRDFERPPNRPRNEPEVAAYSRSLGQSVQRAIEGDRFVVVIGGDCSVVLGCLIGSSLGGEPVGLAYVDAHADYATPEESQTGSVASMALALAVGHGDSILARLHGSSPVVRGGDVALVGRRDADQPWYGHAALAASGILDLPDPSLTDSAIDTTADAVLDRVARSELGGFFILVDCDVIDPAVVPAVGSPEPGGPSISELSTFLRPLVAHPKARGLALTLYDPSLDPDRTSGKRLVTLLASALSVESALAP